MTMRRFVDDGGLTDAGSMPPIQARAKGTRLPEKAVTEERFWDPGSVEFASQLLNSVD